MNYEIVETEFMGKISRHVVITHEDGSMESFPMDEDNSRYQQFLETLEGNEPEVIDG